MRKPVAPVGVPRPLESSCPVPAATFKAAADDGDRQGVVAGRVGLSSRTAGGDEVAVVAEVGGVGGVGAAGNADVVHARVGDDEVDEVARHAASAIGTDFMPWLSNKRRTV